MDRRWVLSTGAALGALAGGAAAEGRAPSHGALSATVGFDTSRAVPIEGAIAFVEVRGANGLLVASRALRTSHGVTLRLAAGRYRLTTYARTCDGSCATLDAPTARCVRDIRILTGTRLRARVTIRWGQQPPCTLSLRR